MTTRSGTKKCRKKTRTKTRLRSVLSRRRRKWVRMRIESDGKGGRKEKQESKEEKQM